VIVAGCGYAGAMAAIAAHDSGARVLVLEKADEAGGISVCSAGGVRVAENADQALSYLIATNGDTTPEPVLRRLAEGMVGLPAVIDRLAEGHSTVVGRRVAAANYPLPGHRTFGFVYVDDLDGFDALQTFPNVRGSPEGARLFRLLQLNLEQRGIQVRCGVAVDRLVLGARGEVEGVRARRVDGSEQIYLRAEGGVVLACGGFEGAPDLQKQYWSYQPVLNAAYRQNTGDGIRLAQEAGAGLWHMWHFHGSYGFKHPDPNYPFGIRTKRVPDWLPGEGPPDDVKVPWILLDRDGQRFMNEYEPYLQDTGARPLGRYRPEIQGFAALPAWLVADDDGRALYPFGRPTWHEAGVGYEWSTDNQAEIELGILRQAESVEALAKGMNIPVGQLEASIDRWNASCEAAGDADFDRPATSMMPIRRPPFVYGHVWPIVSNTQGGPMHDEEQRVLHSFGQPIPGLYAAGECGSVFGHLYMSGGNLAECFVGGGIAGRAAAARAKGIAT
ncbi:MAG: FAD-binding protein, partial [Pseudomonadota bacterium]